MKALRELDRIDRPPAAANPRGEEPRESPPPVTFFSIEEAGPVGPFWRSLARLLLRLGEAAHKRGARS